MCAIMPACVAVPKYDRECMVFIYVLRRCLFATWCKICIAPLTFANKSYTHRLGVKLMSAMNSVYIVYQVGGVVSLPCWLTIVAKLRYFRERIKRASWGRSWVCHPSKWREPLSPGARVLCQCVTASYQPLSISKNKTRYLIQTERNGSAKTVICAWCK